MGQLTLQPGESGKVRLGLDMNTYEDFCSKEAFYREEMTRAEEASDTFTVAQVGLWYDELIGVNPNAVREFKRQRALAEQALAGADLGLPEQLTVETYFE